MLESVCGDKGALLHCGQGMETGAATKGEECAGSLKKKKNYRMPTSGHISEESHSRKRHRHPSVHSSAIYNSQDAEAP